MPSRHRLSSFSILLIMGALMLIGGVLIPRLNVQYTPPAKTNNISVFFNWSGASARVIETEVTSRIEGILARIDGVDYLNSVSGKGWGRVDIGFKKGIRMDMARFQVASQIRYIYPSLPQGVSYPTLSLNTSGISDSPALTYTVNADLSSDEIGQYITEHMLTPLGRIEGVSDVRLSGLTPFVFEIAFDPAKAAVLGISGDEIATAINNYFREDAVGMVTLEQEQDRVIQVKIANTGSTEFDDIPIKRIEGRTIYLRDVAEIRYTEAAPDFYYRINGLNTVNIAIFIERNSNLIGVANEVKRQMTQLSASFPENFSRQISVDNSEYVNTELHKIYIRTLLTLAILLVFVFVVSRNFSYSLIIFSTLLANILVAVIFYNLFGLSIHLYTLAGITVSLGIIIDTSIIMTDHYSSYKDHRVFTAILGALLTTIAALAVIFFLPEDQKQNLADFAMVIIINLVVSLLVSLMFIPALLDKFPLRRNMVSMRNKSKRRAVRFNRGYMRFIAWGRRHRWIFIIVLILGFGLPIHMFPAKLDQDPTDPKWWKTLYNKTIGSNVYQRHKEVIEQAFGGSYRLFSQATKSSNYFRVPERKQLYIRAGMPEGCTVQQLNEVIKRMENYLSQFDEIEMFQTSITGHDHGFIDVFFKPEYEHGAFPSKLKQNVIQMATQYGGATWAISGIDDQGFSNNIQAGGKVHRITLRGYNYDELLGYAQRLLDTMAINRRVQGAEIYGGSWSVPQQEYYVQIDKELAVHRDIDIYQYFNYLRLLLFDQSLRPIFIDGRQERVSLVSTQKESFDLWNVKYNPLQIDTMEVKLNDFAHIDKRPMGIDIFKYNQSYEISIVFDFIGSYELADRMMNDYVAWLNDKVLPIGYQAERPHYGLWGAQRSYQFLLILLVIAIIYIINAILFESLLKPFIIILMIPISFIGVFLTFGTGWFSFDQGGAAAFLLLSGIVVNAGIYIVNEYNNLPSRDVRQPLRGYMKAYSHKIIPILLTVLSTILGLIPFLYDGKDDVFWYAFAIGAMGGMVFSLVALFIYLPIFLPLKRRRVIENR